MEIDFDELDALEELERQNAALLSELDLEASTNGMQPPVINCNRIWAMSDVHTDAKENMQWLKSMHSSHFLADCCIVAGDVCNSMNKMYETLSTLVSKFKVVMFIPGNHDLWLTSDKALYADSTIKLQAILDMCTEIGVLTMPALLRVGERSLWLIPMLSWYSQTFDTEPALNNQWTGYDEPKKTMTDFMLCKWPAELDPSDDSVADYMDQLNDIRWRDPLNWSTKTLQMAFERMIEAPDSTDVEIVSFSHFLSRLELLPERRYLYYPELAKAVGSNALGRRVAHIRPVMHVFGHTHFGWDQTIEGIRYVSAPLGMPAERRMRMSTVACGDFPQNKRAESNGEDDAAPLLILDAGGPVETAVAGWSGFYKAYARDPDQVTVLPDYVADQLTWGGNGEAPVGWEGKKPAWTFGPKWTLSKQSA